MKFLAAVFPWNAACYIWFGVGTTESLEEKNAVKGWLISYFILYPIDFNAWKQAQYAWRSAVCGYPSFDRYAAAWVKGNRLFKRLFLIHMVDSQLFAQSVVLISTIWKTSAKIEKLWCLNRVTNVSNKFLFFVSCEIVTLFLLDVFYSESSMLQLLGCKCAREWSISNPQ